jgi:uncharacterized protein (DUF305 family)
MTIVVTIVVDARPSRSYVDKRDQMTRQRSLIFLAVAAAAALAVGGTVAAARSTPDSRAAAPAVSSAPPVRVVVPGRPGESAAVTDSDRVKAPDGSAYNSIDVAFVQMMIAHHAQALRMAELAPSRAGDSRVRAIAERIAAAQGPEADMLRAWLRKRGLPETDPAHDHAGMPGMQSEPDLQALAAARAADFDRRFVKMMSAHHRGAITMAGDVLGGGADQTVAELANEMGVEQTVEIRRMEQLGVR